MTPGYGTGSDARKRLREARDALEQACENHGPEITTVALGDLTEGERPLETRTEGLNEVLGDEGRHQIDGLGQE